MRLTAALAMVGVLLTPQLANAACSCKERQPHDALQASKFAVLARVAAVRTIDSFVDSTSSPLPPRSTERELFRFYLYEVTLVVDKRFKGASPDTLRVVTEYDSCSYFGPFRAPDPGERHLLFFYQAVTAVPLRLWNCGGSSTWERVEPSVRGELLKP